MTGERTVKECLIRALRTFVQAAAGYIVANAAAVTVGAAETDMLKSALVGLGVSAIAAGFAALMNKPKSGSTDEAEERAGE